MISADSLIQQLTAHLRRLLDHPDAAPMPIDIAGQVRLLQNRVLQDGDRPRASDWNYLAALLDSAGYHEESLQLLESALTASGDDNEYKAALLNQLGVLAAYHHGSRAIGYFERALHELAPALSPLWVAKLQTNLATSLLSQGLADEAAQWVERALPISAEIGSSRLEIALATALVGIARYHADPVLLRSAVSRLANATALRIAELDPEDPQCLILTSDLAVAQLAVARAERSPKRINSVMDVLRVAAFRLAAHLGAEDPRTLSVEAKATIAEFDLAREEGNGPRIEYLAGRLKVVFDRASRVLADRAHPLVLTLAAHAAIADIELARARLNTAVQNLRYQVPLIERHLGERHELALTMAANLAATEIEVAQAESSGAQLGRARVLMAAVFERLEHILGESHPLTVTTRAHLRHGRHLSLIRSLDAVDESAIARVADDAARISVTQSGNPDEVAIFEAIAGSGDLDAALGVLQRLPESTPKRGWMAAWLIPALIKAATPGDLADRGDRISQLAGLLEIAEQDPPPDSSWPRVRDTARLMTAIASLARGEGDPAAMLAQVEAIAQAGDPALRPLIEPVRMVAGFARTSLQGDESNYARLTAHAETIRTMVPDNPQAAALTEIIQDLAGFMAARSGGDVDVMVALEELRARIQRLGPDSPLAAMMDETITLVAPFASRFDGVTAGPIGVPRAEQVTAIEKLIANPSDNEANQAYRHLAAGGAALRGGEEIDPDRIADAIDHFRAALEFTAPDSPERPFRLGSIALALLRRNELTQDVADLGAAAELLEEARTLAGGPQHPTWKLLSEMLAEVQLRRGAPGPHRFAFSALHSTAMTLLQGDAAAARLAASDAAESATSAAWRCLADGDSAGALRALEVGRGLMLFAATELRDIVPRLSAAGRPDLAERWQAATAAEASESMRAGLRGDVLSVLVEESDLLKPPSLAEIQESLRQLDADALVYLVPSAHENPGFALIAPAAGPPGMMMLPNLTAGAHHDVERYVSALVNRESAPLTAHAQAQAANSLDALCSWAWHAAIGPIVKQFLPALPKPTSGRPYRLVFVPIGELAPIPWQAARSEEGKYALESVAFSYATSARMLCRAAALAPVPSSPVGLVVGDPDTRETAQPLTAARIEAFAIHQTFYRGGRYLGRRADGTASRAGIGTANEVRDWLAATRPGAGAMLHLACHGVIEIDEGRPSSHLLLAGGERITAQEIFALMTKAPDRGLGLVVLVACHTGQSVDGYDEAYSLSTAFLAGGARSVVSTQWAVPDQATSILMFMFHYYLAAQGLPAWDALRRAQLWMLDPARVPPESMPTALRRFDWASLAQVEAWAGFVHWGQ